jgi:3-isopropylmalate/(R)-2-methylmalate dehydratase small subunit
MTGISIVTGVAAPLIRANIDTDAIIPSREIKGVSKTGLADGLFAGWRYRDPARRDPDPDFILNRPGYAHASILLGGANFGCGSSREHAVWALHEYGVRAVVAPGFAPIFRANCIRGGIIPVVLDIEIVQRIAALDGPVTVDLSACTVAAGGESWPFAIDPQSRTMLLEGLDPIDLTLKQSAAIEAFHQRDRPARPWIYLKDSA